ncbi:hypothetical protein DFJ63DRAFT_153163 [Scheffersomyces coipomensis]|uniref:uncharacterized protein n=1 Tax=Scheffersomyces coipomensis TaxID=1788519 RepID=UPI00315C7FDE
MKQKLGSISKDAYMLNFVFYFFPKLPYDIILHIYSLLTIPHILILQSISHDEYIRSVRIKQITNKRYSFDYPEITERTSPADLISQTKEIIQIKESFKIMINLTRNWPSNIIPVEIELPSRFASKLLNELLGDSTNFDLALKFSELDYEDYINLQTSKKSQLVSSIIAYEVSGGSQNSTHGLDLDFLNYSNLRIFSLEDYDNIDTLNLDSIFYTLTELTVTNIFEDDFLTKFINLKILWINYVQTFYIKHLPRNIIALTLQNIDYEESSCIRINSSAEWPQTLKSITFNKIQEYWNEDVCHCKLPENLEILKYSSADVTWQTLPELPESLIELHFDTLSQNELDIDDLFQSKLQFISIQGLTLVHDPNISIEALHGLKVFSVSVEVCDFPLDSIYFENAKSSLRELSIYFEKQLFPSTNLNFSDFNKLTSISLSGCKIGDLNILELPACLISLEISRDYFKLVDNTCSLFANPPRYHNLLHLKIYGIKHFSPRVQFPTNLETLRISHYRTRRILSKIMNLKYLTYFEINESVGPMYILDDFREVASRNTNFISTLKSLEINFGKHSRKVVMDSFCDKFENVFGKKIVSREYNFGTFVMKFEEVERIYFI